jgi:pyrroloquinoline quinone (PQQ) biosynthesis protein C
MAKRLEAFQEHYSWVRPEGFDYFRRRVTQARTDSQEALELTVTYCNSKALQEQAGGSALVQMQCIMVDAGCNSGRLYKPQTRL